MADRIIQQPIAFPYVYGERIENLYPYVRITIERITPEVAMRMLGANVNNRDLNPNTAVVKALENGEWEMNGETIVFDQAGVLIDGQHRLSACVKTGKPIETVVVRGIEHDAQITMDTGLRRNLRDYTKMRGYDNHSKVSSIGLALYIADSYGVARYFTDSHGGKSTFKSVMAYIDENYDSRIKPIVSGAQSVQQRYKKVNIGTLAVLFDVFRRAGEDNYKEFIGQLIGNRPACTSVRLLQNKLAANAATTDKAKQLTQKFIAVYTIKAWNAYMRGDDIMQLKYAQGGANAEKFPEVFLGYE